MVDARFLKQPLLRVDLHRATLCTRGTLRPQRTGSADTAECKYLGAVCSGLRLGGNMSGRAGDRVVVQIESETAFGEQPSALVFLGYLGKKRAARLGKLLTGAAIAIGAVAECLINRQSGIGFCRFDLL